MITSFEVGAVFKIVNQASPALLKILEQVRTLNKAIDKARENLALLSKGGIAPNSLTAAVGETEGLAAAWGNVARNAAAAQRAIGNASSSAARSAPMAAAAVGGGRGGARHRPRWLGGGAHVAGPGASIPGGGHVRFGGGAMAAAGLLGYGVYEAAEMQDAVWQLIYHSGGEQNDANRSKFRKILQDSMSESGYGLHDIAESAKQEIRMFQGTPGGGIDVLPEMLRAATIESRLKGESPEASMKALIGLAHMTKKYSPEAIKKLAPAFAFLSTANPSSLSSIERAAGYAVPLLQSGLEIDPMQTLLLGTALTRAGATNTKSGTWLREMALRAMPGTSMMSKMAFKKHEEALKEVGLVDDQHKPTWFTDGKPDLLKMLDIAGANAQKIPIEKRAAIERGLFGAQGGGGFALLADPAVREQILSLQKEMNSSEFKNRYGGFVQAYQQGSTVQAARTGMAEFNNTMMDLGQIALPGVNRMLGEFKGVLAGIRSVLPGNQESKSDAFSAVLAHAGWGAAAGAGAGYFLGGVGAVPGALIGGAAGGIEGFYEGIIRKINDDKAKSEAGASGAKRDAASNAAAAAAAGAMPPISITMNLDGKTLSQVLIDRISKAYGNFDTSAPGFNGANSFGP